MVALARDLNFFGAGFLAGLSAIFVAGFNHAQAW